MILFKSIHRYFGYGARYMNITICHVNRGWLYIVKKTRQKQSGELVTKDL